MSNAIPSLSWRGFSLPKAGNSQAEYEDAFGTDASQGRFAIADGASESSFAGPWAKGLVEGYIHNPGSWSRWLPGARKTWFETFQDHEFSWYTEEKFNEGAFATFLGIAIDRLNQKWQAVAVGDCCLFHMHDQILLHAFPVDRSSAFGNQPDLIGSRTSSSKINRLRMEGDWRLGDRMFLMTDALAQWFLQKMENQQEPWKEIIALTNQEAFEEWIGRIRENKELRNDDVTLMVID